MVVVAAIHPLNNVSGTEKNAHRQLPTVAVHGIRVATEPSKNDDRLPSFIQTVYYNQLLDNGGIVIEDGGVLTQISERDTISLLRVGEVYRICNTQRVVPCYSTGGIYLLNLSA